MPVGLHRIRKGWGTEHSVMVRYEDGYKMEMPQSRYEDRGYQPPFDQLPWLEEDQNAQGT